MADLPSLPPGAWEADLFRLLVENTRDYAIFVADPDGRVLTWNPGAEHVVGYQESEIVGRSSFLLFTPEDRADGVPERELRKALADGRADDDRWHVRKDGGRFWARGVMVPLRDEDGGVRGFAKILRDFTKEKTANEALIESESRLRVALLAAQVGTWLWRVPTNEQILDDSLRKLMGLRPDDQVHSLDDFLHAVHSDDRARVRAEFERGVQQGSDLNVEFRVIWPDGSLHWLRDQGKVFPGPDGRPAFMTGACADLTDRKRLEEELRMRAAQLAEEGRRKDEFLAMLGHELRNPLAPIRTLIEVLRAQPGDDPRRRHSYEVIARQVSHLSRLVDDLLDVSRITRGKIDLRKEPIDLAVAAGQAVEMVRPLVDARRHELTVALPARPLRVEADPTRLTQVLHNLLENAAKYTDPGGRIWLTVERQGDRAVVRVKDTGKGIAPDLLGRVFDVFTQGERTLDRTQGGLGLGLTLVRRLVEMHGGRVEAYSDGPGQGSEFVVRLPVSTAATASAPPTAPEVRAAPETRAGRVLVVDDNVDVAESLAMLLERLAGEVHMANSGRQAIEIVRTFRPDAVFLDIGLPGMDGYEVARRLRQDPNLNGVPLVAVSGYGQEEDIRRSREAGFAHHLVKPVGLEELEAVLRTRARADGG